MRRVTTTEIPALHDTLESTTLGDADGVHKVADFEERGSDDFAGLHFFREVAELLDLLNRGRAKFLEVTKQRLRHALFLLVDQTELNGIVAIFARLSLDLNNAIRPCQHDSHRNGNAIRVIYAGMAQFLSKQSEWHRVKS